MGYIFVAALVTLIIGGAYLALQILGFGSARSQYLMLQVVVPEDLNFAGQFEDIFDSFTTSTKLVSVKTTNMGSLYKLTWRVCLADSNQIQQRIDAIRTRNGNLEVALYEAPETEAYGLLHLVFLISSYNRAVLVSSADRVFLTMADNTTNSISATGALATDGDDTVDGAIFSRSDLTINGSGTLSITSSQGHGIVSKDDLTCVGATVQISAANKGMTANDTLAIASGTWTIDAGEDTIHSSNDEDTTLGNIVIEGGTLNLTSGSDGLDASGIVQIDDGELQISAADDGAHADSSLAINGGTINVDESNEGIEGATIQISGGQISVTSTDDGLNAYGNSDAETDQTASIDISGGTTTIDASGDGIDSNGSFTMSGGTVYVSGPTNDGNGALDVGTEATVTGGSIIAAGSSGMAVGFSDVSTQASATIFLDSETSGTITLTDSSGTTLATFDANKSYFSIVISTPDMSVGSTYTLTTGDTSQEIQLSDTVTQVGSGNTMGGMGDAGAMGGSPSGQGNGPFSAPGSSPDNSSMGQNQKSSSGSKV